MLRELNKSDGATIACHFTAGRSPTVVFLGGYASDMTGTKAMHLEAFCRERGQAYLRFDYQGHGASSGAFVDGTIGTWADDALFAIDQLTTGPLVLVGSSLGGWIMVLVARRIADRVRALVGIAAAPDFTEDLVWRVLTPEQRRTLETEGILYEPSEYQEEPLPVTLRLIEEAREHLVLTAPIDLHCPVRLIHGTDDHDVPWETSQRLMSALRSSDVLLTLVKDGDHRLSDPRALHLLAETVVAASATGTEIAARPIDPTATTES
ncbi:MAG: alpha/beta hydrolase [Gammaproteobacteria bacterium]|nr:alpha/beta hydrolase [Gammaproteobacteria bacterium]NIR58739.1 alpha/beta hydrolase [Gammaproteobacteria bacterium]NIR88593.1 alpha/beta hydrolase [Gammaproteobacteria bacterium]